MWAIRMEPYADVTGKVLAYLELALMFQVGVRVVNLGAQVQHGVRQYGRRWIPQHCWVLIESTSLGLCLYMAIRRVQFIWLVYTRPLPLPQTNYPAVQELLLLQSEILSVNTINVLLHLGLMFRFVSFQDRMSLFSLTLSRAWVDLYHFIIVFFFIFTGYALIGHMLFGSCAQVYSSAMRAIQSQFEMMLGNYDADMLFSLNPYLAQGFIISFEFLVSMVLIGVLLAILVDTYTRLLRESHDPNQPLESIPEQLMRWHACRMRGTGGAGGVTVVTSPRGDVALEEHIFHGRMMSGDELLELLCSLEREGEREEIPISEVEGMAAASLKNLLPLLHTRTFAVSEVPQSGDRRCSLSELKEEEENVSRLETLNADLQEQVEEQRQQALIKRHIWSEFHYAQSAASTPRVSSADSGIPRYAAIAKPAMSAYHMRKSRKLQVVAKGTNEEEEVVEVATGGYQDPFFARLDLEDEDSGGGGGGGAGGGVFSPPAGPEAMLEATGQLARPCPFTRLHTLKEAGGKASPSDHRSSFMSGGVPWGHGSSWLSQAHESVEDSSPACPYPSCPSPAQRQVPHIGSNFPSAWPPSGLPLLPAPSRPPRLPRRVSQDADAALSTEGGWGGVRSAKVWDGIQTGKSGWSVLGESVHVASAASVASFGTPRDTPSVTAPGRNGTGWSELGDDGDGGGSRTGVLTSADIGRDDECGRDEGQEEEEEEKEEKEEEEEEEEKEEEEGGGDAVAV
jgi:hypothetical protein